MLGTIILGNPTANSVTANLMTTAALDVYFEYGETPEVYTGKTDPVTTTANVPAVFVFNALKADNAYHYRARYRSPGAPNYEMGDVKDIHTQRPVGQSFTFTIQADSHRDENSDFDLYKTALANIRADKPDFHVDLGDTFMTEKYATTKDEVVSRYIEERAYFGLIADTIPLLLVNGNHEGEVGWLLNGTDNNLAVWATNARLAYYVNPLPDGFYSGDATSYPFVGQRGGYFAWQWGDALFVAIDPFWFTVKKPAKTPYDGWAWTLGSEQYHWLENVLTTSKAKYKFVFSHHMVGGAPDARGGIEPADRWEWGGQNEAGVNEFAAKRPGFSRPIHQLFVDTKVSAWFHGHDHLYCKQDKDGIVYQEVPQPSHRGENGQQSAMQWGYLAGKVLSSSGHIRVTVASDKATVEYVKAYLPADETPTAKNGDIGDSYTVMPAP